jgi:hypothetical protein
MVPGATIPERTAMAIYMTAQYAVKPEHIS